MKQQKTEKDSGKLILSKSHFLQKCDFWVDQPPSGSLGFSSHALRRDSHPFSLRDRGEWSHPSIPAGRARSGGTEVGPRSSHLTRPWPDYCRRVLGVAGLWSATWLRFSSSKFGKPKFPNSNFRENSCWIFKHFRPHFIEDFGSIFLRKIE